MPDRKALEVIPASLAMKYGAQNAVAKSLNVAADDVVTLVCDRQTVAIGAALLREIDAIGASVSCFVLENHTTRPTTILPAGIENEMRRSTASIYAVVRQANEFAHRGRLIEVAGECKLRHAHMVDVNESAMQQGMLADATKIARLNQFLIDMLRKASSIRLSSAAGTDLAVALRQVEPIYGSSGVIESGRWENLPTGEIYTVPDSVDGIYVCDNSYSIPDLTVEKDRFALGANPVRMEFEHGYLKSSNGGPGGINAQIMELVNGGENLDRCGLFGIGTNFELLMPSGECMQDVNLPGAYISLGRALGDVSTYQWSSSSQYLFVGRQVTVSVDGVEIIKKGRFDPSLLARITAPSVAPVNR